MLPYILVALILAYLSLLGLGIATLVDRRISYAALLASPPVGLGVLLGCILTLNRAGLPVTTCALPVVLTLGLSAVLVVALRRPIVPWGAARAVTLPLAAGLLLAGLPMLLFGLHWAGNSNGDMTLYVSSALGFMHYGFFHVPMLTQVISNADTAVNMWFWEVMPPNRYGGDVFVAIVAAVFHLPPLQVYMSCSVAGFGAVVLATAAMCGDRPQRMMLGALIMAVAMPLMLYTVYQQVLPQLLGQAAMIGIVALIGSAAADPRMRLQRAILLGSSLVALLFIYPEISPLLLIGGAFAAPFAIALRRDTLNQFAREMAESAGVAFATVLVLFNVGIFTLLATMSVLFNIGGRVTGEGVGTLNYYLVPSGLANMWGAVPFDNYPEPWLSAAIVLGAVGFIVMGIFGVRALRKGSLSDGMLVAVMLFCVYLFARRSSYGLFKMVFLLQPFLVPFCVAVIIEFGNRLGKTRWISQRVAWAIPAGAFILATSYSTYVYLGSTSDVLSKKTAQFTELHRASSDDLYGQLNRIAESFRGKSVGTPLVTDALLQNLAIIEGTAFIGHPLTYEALDPFSGYYGASYVPRLPPIVGWPSGTRVIALSTAKARTTLFEKKRLGIGSRKIEVYVPPKVPATVARQMSGGVLIETGANLSILNRTSAPDAVDVRAVPLRRVRNWLSFVDSQLGSPPETQPSGTGLGAVEPDPFDHEKTIATIGKSMLLEVLNSDPQVRLKLSLSATFNPRPFTDLPAITLVGADTVRMPSRGAGSERIITPPVRPVEINGHRYIALKFGRRSYKYPSHRTWLMSLYGTDIEVDPREFALFGRDISVAGNRQLRSPQAIADFPKDFLNSSLLYSGVFEDGWLAHRFEVHLFSPLASDALWLRLNAPPGDTSHHITITVDGKIIGKLTVWPSRYVDVAYPSPGVGEHDIVVESSSIGRYLAGDTRPVWARLKLIGFISR